MARAAFRERAENPSGELRLLFLSLGLQELGCARQGEAVSQGDQFSLFVIPWLCHLPGTVTGPGLQLSTALAPWIPILIPTPGSAHHANQRECHPPLAFPIPFASLALQGLCWGFCSLASPALGICHLPGAAGVCHLPRAVGVCPSSILIFQPPKFPFSFLFPGFCPVFLQSAQSCSCFQSI